MRSGVSPPKLSLTRPRLKRQTIRRTAPATTKDKTMDLASVSNFKVNEQIQDFGPGDRVRVSAKVVEGDRERIQIFEGDVIKIRNAGPASTFTVRKIASGIGVERTFQRHSPRVDKVEVVRHGKVRRARLYYLRELRGRAARIKEKARVR